MNNQSPLVPQGSMLEQKTKNKGRARVKIAVFFVLAIHGIGLLALLMQGCKNEKDTASNQADTNTFAAASPDFQPTNQVVTNDTNPPVTPTVTTPAQPSVTPVATDNPGTASDYVVAKGDTYVTIAKSKKVSVKALTDANPGVEPTKLQIGQKLHIPAPTAPVVASSGTTGAPATDATGEPLYTVKSGDTLIRIAQDHKTTVRAIRTANNLRTDSIRVGQKLKLPIKMAASSATGPMASNTLSH